MLRDYQSEIVSSVLSRGDNTLIQADTGSGKTRVLIEIAKKHPNVLVIAHRKTLVSQISLEFAKEGIQHSVLATKTTARRSEILHRREIGKSMLTNSAGVVCCSLDSLLSYYKNSKLELDLCKNWLVIIDEAHHVIIENKWGKLCDIFKNARFVGATATPCRLDGVSLKKGKGGIFESLVQAESLKKDSIDKLISRGFISPFKCYGVDPRFDSSVFKVGANGDYTLSSSLSEYKKHVQLMAGDAVKYYKKLALGKPAVVFCVSIEIAKKVADSFKKEGISAAAIHSKMSSKEVDYIFDLFVSKQINVLCNVDMSGEGVDIPAIEVLIMLRKTASFGLYRQWVGRSLRPLQGKDYAIIIDHADNIKTHGLPNRHVNWCLDRPPVYQKSSLIDCKSCGFLFKAWLDECPECGEKNRSENGFSEKDIKYIDVRLVELYRTKREKESRDLAIAATVDENNIKHLRKTDGRAAEACTKVARWFYNNVKERVTVLDIEQFFYKNNNINFWATHFKIEDLDNEGFKKCMKVFNEN